jgi:hypothetical protein
MVSFGKADPFAFSNLLSTVINEVLEIVFLQHAEGPPIELGLYQLGAETLIVTDLSVDQKSRAFYLDTARELETRDVQSLYTAEILREGPASRAIGLYELAANYGARIEVADKLPEKKLCLRIWVALDCLVEEQQK